MVDGTVDKERERERERILSNDEGNKRERERERDLLSTIKGLELEETDKEQFSSGVTY